MSGIGTEASSEQVKIQDEAKLLSLVVDKHKRFIREYTEEHNNLGAEIETKHSEYNRINKELEALETRIVVLKEKRHQLYHQTAKLRMRMLEDMGDSDKLHHLNNEIEEIENRLQNANMSPDEEYASMDRIESLLKGAVPLDGDSHNTAQEVMSSISDILATARSARSELEEMIDAPQKHQQECRIYKEEFEKMESRRKWLERRIELHTQALEYWEQQATGAVGQ